MLAVYELLPHLSIAQHIVCHGHHNEFDNDQRKELWKLMLVTKYQLKKQAVFKSFEEFKNKDISNVPPNDRNMLGVNADSRRTTPNDISRQSLVSCLHKYYLFYPNTAYWSAQTCFIVPFLYVFNDMKDGSISTDINVEYDAYLCYSSLVSHAWLTHCHGNDDKLKERLLKIDNFWARHNDNGRGNAREMLECYIGRRAGDILSDQALKCLEPKLYQKLNELDVTTIYYGHKPSIFFLFYVLGNNRSENEMVIKFFDYLILFGFGNVLLWQIAFLILKKEEIMQSQSFDTLIVLINDCSNKPNWDFDVLCGIVHQLRHKLKKKNPELLKYIMEHGSDVDVVIEILGKYC